MKLELDLTPEEYQQLVECYFAGSVVLEELYPNIPDPEPNIQLSAKINSQAANFGKENLVFSPPEMEDICTISQEVESRVIPILFGED